jgi:hypothetical protein
MCHRALRETHLSLEGAQGEAWEHVKVGPKVIRLAARCQMLVEGLEDAFGG